MRIIDLPTLGVDFRADGAATVSDQDGTVAIGGLAPYLLFGYPAAAHAVQSLARECYLQNPLDAVLVADDKAATAGHLAADGVAQVATMVCAMEDGQAIATAEKIGYPVVLKRTHGAQGKWVRRAADAAGVRKALGELELEGPGALIVQPEIVEAEGRSIRVVLTAGQLLAAAERIAGPDEWRSNIAVGAKQRPIKLTLAEETLAKHAIETLGLKHAGVDLLRTARGPVVLEVNACPDFTSMQPYFDHDLAHAVLMASMPN